MVLVDTSVWVDHLQKGDAGLELLLENAEILIHPFIIGELACGNMKNRLLVLSLLARLPVIATTCNHDVLQMIERRELFGIGLGWVDAHLLASSLLGQHLLWTRDKKLRTAAKDCHVGY